jgi:hypothetical protein
MNSGLIRIAIHTNLHTGKISAAIDVSRQNKAVVDALAVVAFGYVEVSQIARLTRILAFDLIVRERHVPHEFLKTGATAFDRPIIVIVLKTCMRRTGTREKYPRTQPFHIQPPANSFCALARAAVNFGVRRCNVGEVDAALTSIDGSRP